MPNLRERPARRLGPRDPSLSTSADEQPDDQTPAPGDAKKRTRKELHAFLEQARDLFKQGQDATKDQIERELSDIRFYNGEQWPNDVFTARKGQNASNGMPPVPARPCITVNKTREPVRQVLNQERQSDVGIELVPADDFGDLGITI